MHEGDSMGEINRQTEKGSKKEYERGIAHRLEVAAAAAAAQMQQLGVVNDKYCMHIHINSLSLYIYLTLLHRITRITTSTTTTTKDKKLTTNRSRKRGKFKQWLVLNFFSRSTFDTHLYVYTFSKRIRCCWWWCCCYFKTALVAVFIDSVQFIYVNTYQKLILLDSHRKTSTNLFCCL